MEGPFNEISFERSVARVSLGSYILDLYGVGLEGGEDNVLAVVKNRI